MRALGRVVLAVLLLAASTQAQQGRVGHVAFANSGAAAAQAPFLYGLAQLHNFEYDDAARAFREAQGIDPSFAMAYWGEAMTKNHPVWMEQDLAGARRILDRLAPTAAARIAKGGTERERAYLGAVETLFGPGNKFDRDLKYLDAMRSVHADYPDDTEAAAFYALALLGSAHGGRDTATYMKAAAALEEVFAANPEHPGVAHYLIHSYDDPVHAPLGLRAARKYFTIAPDAPHALHMTSHIYLAAGMWDDVVAANERATQVSAERAKAAGRTPAGCGHANMWLMYGYLEQGRPSAARRVLDACRLTATSARGLALRAPEEDPLDPDNIPAASYIQMWSRYLLDTGDWSAELAREDIALGDLAGARLTRAVVRAFGAAARNDDGGLRDAGQEVRRAREDLGRVFAGRRDNVDQFRRRADILTQEVEGLLLLASGRRDDAVAQLRSSADAEARMPVEFGPPFVDKPAAEALADMLAALGRHTEAAAAFNTALLQAPNRAPALLGLARALEKAGDTAASRSVYSRLRAVWHAAEQIPDDVRSR